MPFHSVPSPAVPSGRFKIAPAPTAIQVEEPLVCAVNHQKERERDERTTVIVLRPFAYTLPDNSRTIRVPPTYLTDFASIPTYVRWVIPPFGRHAIAAVLHDWLYTVGQPGRRPEADHIFRLALAELGVGLVRRNAMYAAVRAGGGDAYDRAPEDWSRSFMEWRGGDLAIPSPARTDFYDDAWPPNVPTVDLGGPSAV